MILDIMIENKFISSKAEGRRLIEQSGIKYKIDNDVYDQPKENHWKTIDRFDYKPMLS